MFPSPSAVTVHRCREWMNISAFAKSCTDGWDAALKKADSRPDRTSFARPFRSILRTPGFFCEPCLQTVRARKIVALHRGDTTPDFTTLKGRDIGGRRHRHFCGGEERRGQDLPTALRRGVLVRARKVTRRTGKRASGKSRAAFFRTRRAGSFFMDAVRMFRRRGVLYGSARRKNHLVGR